MIIFILIFYFAINDIVRIVWTSYLIKILGTLINKIGLLSCSGTLENKQTVTGTCSDL